MTGRIQPGLDASEPLEGNMLQIGYVHGSSFGFEPCRANALSVSQRMPLLSQGSVYPSKGRKKYDEQEELSESVSDGILPAGEEIDLAKAMLAEAGSP
jgi:hypothetical protein